MGRPLVMIFLPSLAGGGAERAITMVANGLADRGAEVMLVLGQRSGPYLDLVSPTVQVIDLGAKSMLQALPRLACQMRALRPAAVLSAMSHANVVVALAHRLSGSQARLVLSERAHMTSVLQEYQGLRMRATSALMRLTYPWADQVVAVSRGVAEDLPRHVPMSPSRIVTVYNPVIDEHLRRQAEAPSRHRWLARPEVPVVLAAGRLIPQKDFHTLLQAFARIRRQRRVRLVILGEGELRKELITLAEKLGVAGDVDLPGFEANPFAAMRAASVFVLSSRFEGLPGVLIQAMACGARVVSTDCPSGPREILEDGRWGALVPVGDPEALAGAVQAALDDPLPPDVRTRAAAFSVHEAVNGYARALGITLSAGL